MKYTRIDIKREADLPKVNGEYFAHRIDYNEITLRTFKIGEPKLHYNHAYYLNFWLKNIDWYLIEDTEKSYPEEFVEWLLNYAEIDICATPIESTPFNEHMFKWKIPVETHVFEYMSTSEAYLFWKTHVKDK